MHQTTPVSNIFAPDASNIRRAAQAILAGDLVAFPTETVYGLGADARLDNAVARIFAAKGRPGFNPLIVHVANTQAAQRIAKWSPQAEALASLWPGPLTLVLPLKSDYGLSSRVTAGLSSVAIRIPDHAAALALLDACAAPLAAPSANPSGCLSPTHAQHVAAHLGEQVSMILDAGPARVGVESTIVSLIGAPRILRPGGISHETLEAHLGHKIIAPSSAQNEQSSTPMIAPGQLASHYAPRGALRMNVRYARAGEVMLGFGLVTGDLNLSATGNLNEAAARLFDALHELDQTGRPIAVASIPEHGLGAAINDRLRRAAAPR